MSNRLLQQLDIVYPIIQAPMAGVSTPELAAAVSNAGGLGSLGLGASSVSQARALIDKTRRLTDRAFNVNLFATFRHPETSRLKPGGLSGCVRRLPSRGASRRRH